MNKDIAARVLAKLNERLQVQHTGETVAPTIEGLNEAAAEIASLFGEIIKENAASSILSFDEFVKETTVPVQFVEPNVSDEDMQTIMSSDLLVDQPVGSAGLTPVVNTDPVETTAGPGIQAEADLAATGVATLTPVEPESTEPVLALQVPAINATPEVPRWWEENDKEAAEAQAYAPVAQPAEGEPQSLPVVESADANFDMTAMKMLSEEQPFLMFVKLNRTQKGVSSGDEAIMRTVYNDYVKSDAALSSRLREIASGK